MQQQSQPVVGKIQITNRFSGRVLFECDEPAGKGEVIRHLLSACVVAESGCVEWALAKTSGAGRIRHEGRAQYAHRVMYQCIHGPIPAGLLVRHSCDNRACIRPDHLELGTHADNMQDMVQRGRSTKGRALTADHRMRLSSAGRGKPRPAHVKEAISQSVRATLAAKRVAITAEA